MIGILLGFEELEAVGGGVGIVTSPITGGGGGCTWAPYCVLFLLEPSDSCIRPILPLLPLLPLPPAFGNGRLPSSFNASASASSSSDPDIGGEGNGTGFVVYRTLLCCVGSFLCGSMYARLPGDEKIGAVRTEDSLRIGLLLVDDSGTIGNFCEGSVGNDLDIGIVRPWVGDLFILNGATIGSGAGGRDRKCEASSSSIRVTADFGGGWVGGITTGGGELGRESEGRAHDTVFLVIVDEVEDDVDADEDEPVLS